ncbi:hypothetical protein DFS34DRAFT_689852 [Phlyctochytrium arcticum]|nr:hypothetical protein DFS34DRAFT_689852 [Phlyctochytrium arcticum]
MNNLGSYLAAKAAQSRSPHRPQAHRSFTLQSHHDASPTRITAPSPPPPQRTESLISAADAFSIVACPPSTSGRGPMVTSPSPTDGNPSPNFSPIRGLWESTSAQTSSDSLSKTLGGGLLDDFEFDFEGPSSGSGKHWKLGGDHSGKRPVEDDEWKFGFEERTREEPIEVNTRPPSYEIVREGWISVQMKISWCRFYGILTNKGRSAGDLQLYEGQDDEAAVRVMDLSSCIEIQQHESSSGLSTGRYQLRLIMKGRQDLFMAFDTSSDRSKWSLSLEMLLLNDGAVPVPSAPELEQLEGFHHKLPASVAAHSLFTTSVGRFDSDKHIPASPTRRSSASLIQVGESASATGNQSIQAELTQIKDLIVKILDYHAKDTPSTNPEDGIALASIRGDLSRLTLDFDKTVKNLVQAVADLKEDNGARVNTSEVPPDVEAALVDLTESMEMRTSKIAKMVHELLQQKTGEGSLTHVISEVQKNLQQFSVDMKSSPGLTETALQNVMATLGTNVANLQNLEEIAKSGALNLSDNAAKLDAISDTLAQMQEDQQQHDTDFGAVMGMVAEASQSSGGREKQILQEVQKTDKSLANIAKNVEKNLLFTEALEKSINSSHSNKHDLLQELKHSIEGMRSDLTSRKSDESMPELLERMQQLTQQSNDLQKVLTASADGHKTLTGFPKMLEEQFEKSHQKTQQQMTGIDKMIQLHHQGLLTKSDIRTLSETVQDLQGRVVAALARPAQSPRPAADNIDRPMSKMITGINEKLIHLSKLLDHIQETQTGRFSAMEDKLNNLPVSNAVHSDDETNTDKMLQQNKLTDIRNCVQNVEEKISRNGRESQTRHDVVDGRLDRVSEQLKHMQRTITKLVQVGLLSDGDEGNKHRAEHASENGPDRSSSQRSILNQLQQELAEIKEHMADDVTADRMQDLLAMFTISQDTQATMVEKVSSICNELLPRKDLEDIKTAVLSLSKSQLSAESSTVGPADGITQSLAEISIKIDCLALREDNLLPQSKTSDDNRHITESIHDYLQTYLPTDLTSRLSSIQSQLSCSRPSPFIVTRAPPPPTSDVGSPRHADLKDVFSPQLNTTFRDRMTPEPLMSAQTSPTRQSASSHSVEHSRPQSPSKPYIRTTASVAPNMDMTDIREAIQTLLQRTAPAQSSPPAKSVEEQQHLQDSIAGLEEKREGLSREIDEMFCQRQLLIETLARLESKVAVTRLETAQPRRLPKSRPCPTSRRISCPVTLSKLHIDNPLDIAAGDAA